MLVRIDYNLLVAGFPNHAIVVLVKNAGNWLMLLVALIALVIIWPGPSFCSTDKLDSLPVHMDNFALHIDSYL